MNQIKAKMNFKKSIKNIFKICILSIFLISDGKELKTETKNESQIILKNYIKNIPPQNFYILGPGDSFKIKSFRNCN